jgi:bifunctional DNA-binding transcriptional regulator/antitoxin component of YhaV-PrlF toxin-antitoxin module
MKPMERASTVSKVRVSSRGRVNLPKKLLEKFKIEDGARYQVTRVADGYGLLIKLPAAKA